ncbi:MAG: hypothetical protein KatS3mg110_0185 [Pirellulaceae bacterium]|nr:MAG: hypothetical protein KatS3mg110_0185 [Pirellulaceae bacterium]
MKSWLIWTACGTLLVLAVSGSVQALPKFRQAFEKRYVDAAKNADFAEAVKKEGCNVCHVKGEQKSVRNAYGKVLADLIPGDAQERLKAAGDNKAAEEEKLLKELEEAFTKAEKRPVNGKDGETFGDRIKAGKLPAGDQ